MLTRIEPLTETGFGEPGLEAFARMPEWLTAMVQPQRVQQALATSVPEFVSDHWLLLDCLPKRVRMKRDGWTALYQLKVQAPGHENESRTVVLQGIIHLPGSAEPDLHMNGGTFGMPDWHWYLPELHLELETQPPETVLAALGPLTDPSSARAILEESIRAGASGRMDYCVQSVTPQVVRYKPGSRCTILYHLDYSRELRRAGWPAIVVAKTYRGSKGQNAYDGMRALWASALAKTPTVTIAEPLAYLDEMKVLIQGPIREEQTLKTCLRTALRTNTPESLRELDTYMVKTATGLAALHDTRLNRGDTHSWKDELGEVRELAGRLSAAIPSLVGAAEGLLAEMEILDSMYRPDPAIASHGSFRPAQVLLYQGQIGFIDFDSFCRAEPGLDLGLFLATFRDIALSTLEDDEELKQPPDAYAIAARLMQIDALHDRFIETYSQHRRLSRARVWLWETLELFTIVLHRWTKIKADHLERDMLLLEHQLAYRPAKEN